MNTTRLSALALFPLMLAACGEENREPDTSYEQQLPSPVEDSGDGLGSVPVNDTIEGGPDEQVDEEYAGEEQWPEGFEPPE